MSQKTAVDQSRQVGMSMIEKKVGRQEKERRGREEKQGKFRQQRVQGKK
jgi:hypothetical protein